MDHEMSQFETTPNPVLQSQIPDRSFSGEQHPSDIPLFPVWIDRGCVCAGSEGRNGLEYIDNEWAKVIETGGFELISM
jgi:hypothetical protein